MRRSPACIGFVALALAASAHGEPAGGSSKSRAVSMACGQDLTASLVVPTGWSENPTLGERASRAVAAVGGAGQDAPVRGQARAFSAPNNDAVLVLTWATTPGAAPELAPLAAKNFVADYKRSVRRGMTGQRVMVMSASESVRGARAEARVEWRVQKTKVRGLTRAQAVALASTGFHGFSIQCVYLEKAEKQRRAACEAAVDSLKLASPGVMLAIEGASAPRPAPARAPALPDGVSDPTAQDPGAVVDGNSSPAQD